MKNRYIHYYRLLLIILVYCITMASSGCKSSDKKDKQERTENANLWYMNSIIYNLDVRVFKDSDGDGTGDFNGLTQKLGYLKQLGVDAIWLAPFQPTPNKDDGYDITDYYGIDSKAGTKADFDRFMQAAHKMGIKVMMDIVLNHTSIQHSWYQKARADSNSKYASWYVWSKQRPKNYDEGMAFPGVQTETWTYDEIAKRYYFHRFYDFQPDLNFENKDVQKESLNILDHWLKAGLDGFRLDAVPFIIDRPAEGDDAEPMFNILTAINKFVKQRNPNAILLGEANVAPKENLLYFGEKSNRLQMMFNFYANQYLFYSLANENAATFKKALDKTHDKPQQGQWAYFLRNHDEIDLGRLSKKERNKVYSKFGPEKNMQLYDRGIRRRLAPMINNPKKLALSYSLLFSLPGTPVIRYGEEIGMGDDLTLQERISVRTPMQWNNTEPNAGFTTSNTPYRAMIKLGAYGYPKINVATEEKDPRSIYNVIKQLIAARKKSPEIGLGAWKILDTSNDKTLAIKFDYKGQTTISVYNFSGKPEEITIKSDLPVNATLKGLQKNEQGAAINNGTLKINLQGYAYNWFKVAAN
jgi:maltose alpha-D-glucosyltransferase/alpha-amylase